MTMLLLALIIVASFSFGVGFGFMWLGPKVQDWKQKAEHYKAWNDELCAELRRRTERMVFVDRSTPGHIYSRRDN